MQAALAEVAVERAVVAVPVEQLPQLAQVVAEALGRNGGVLPSFPRVRLVGEPGRRSQARLADLPHPLLLREVVEELHGRRRPVALQLLHQLAGLGVRLLLALPAELHQQPALAVGQQAQVPFDLLHVLGLDVPDQLLVDALQADGAGGQDLGDGVRRPVGVVVAEHQEGAERRAVHQAHLRLQHGDTGALRAHQGLGHVEPLLRQQAVQVVAGDPPRDLRVPLSDQVAVAVPEVLQRGVDLAAAVPGGDDAGQVGVGGRAHRHAQTVVGQDVQLLDVVRGEPAHHRVHAA